MTTVVTQRTTRIVATMAMGSMAILSTDCLGSAPSLLVGPDSSLSSTTDASRDGASEIDDATTSDASRDDGALLPEAGDTLEDGGIGCQDPGMNACGGCGTLAGPPNGACGCNSQFVFQCSADKTSVKCTDPGANACGGCGALSAAPGAACGSCGTYVCGANKSSVTCSDPGLNACGGCGTLSAVPGASCGACGKYVCAAGNASVSCNDPGTTNSCTWCSSHGAPSGVAAADYQCVDFDKGLPSSTVWVPTVAGGGTLALSTAAADSAPNSLSTQVVPGNQTTTLAWNDVGSAPVQTVSVALAINPTSMTPSHSTSVGYVTLLSINTGYTEAWIYYTVGGTDAVGNSNFTGISASAANSGAGGGGSYTSCQCPLDVTNFTYGIWNTVQFDANTSTGNISISINGSTSTCSCVFLKDTAVKVVVGPDEGTDTTSPSGYGWYGYYDNVTVAVTR